MQSELTEQDVLNSVLHSLRELFPQSRSELVIPPERNQSGDVLIELDLLPVNWMTLLEETLPGVTTEQSGLVLTCTANDVRVDVSANHSSVYSIRKKILLDSYRMKPKNREGRMLRDVPVRAQLNFAFVDTLTPNQLVSYYLLSSYAYYHLHSSPFMDTAFDHLCARLLTCLDQVTHQHKYLIAEDILECGSGFHISEEQYPLMVRSAVWDFIDRVLDGSLVREIMGQKKLV
jgi:hypothetical protein